MIEKLALVIFGKERIRKNIYIATLILSLIFLGLSESGVISGTAALYVTLILIAIDLVAYLYDPHPDNPGFIYKLRHIADDFVEELEPLFHNNPDLDDVRVESNSSNGCKSFGVSVNESLIEIACHGCGTPVASVKSLA